MEYSLACQIALALGWKDILLVQGMTDKGEYTGVPPGKLRTYLPRLTLDYMWGLEEGLSVYEQVVYLERLIPGYTFRDQWMAYHATAEQRATAWLKVKDLRTTPS